jgi:leader peptidase (prepilin peptidase)/N-methyltransferase
MNDLTPIFIFGFFALGTIMGSFISMLNFRIKNNLPGKFFGRSLCIHCNKPLKFYDMIPVVSYIILGGKSRYTGEKIPITYLLLELFTGILFAITFTSFNFLEGVNPLITIFWLVIFSIGMAILFYDVAYMEIPLTFTVTMMVIGALGAYFILEIPILSIVLGGLVGKLFFYAQYKLSQGKWVGLGDSDLGLALGLTLGLKLLTLNLFSAYLLGSLFALPLLLGKKANLKTALPFGPFLIIGLYLTALFSSQILDWYFNIALI